MRDGRNIECKNYKVEVEPMTNKVQVREVRWEDEFHVALKALSVDRWFGDINRRESLNRQFGNKLRT